MRVKSPAENDDMRPEYQFDYSTAVRGKYYRRLLKEGANVVVLEPDVARAFRSSAAVNEALRSLRTGKERPPLNAIVRRRGNSGSGARRDAARRL